MMFGKDYVKGRSYSRIFLHIRRSDGIHFCCDVFDE